MNLKEAREQHKLDEFIKEHAQDPKGDIDKFDQALDSMTHPERLKSTQETFSPDSSGN